MSRPYIGPVVKTRLPVETLALLDARAEQTGTTRADALRVIAERDLLPVVTRSCTNCRHNLGDAKNWTCPPAGMDWASEYDIPDDDSVWPPTAPACPGRKDA